MDGCVIILQFGYTTLISNRGLHQGIGVLDVLLKGNGAGGRRDRTIVNPFTSPTSCGAGPAVPRGDSDRIHIGCDVRIFRNTDRGTHPIAKFHGIGVLRDRSCRSIIDSTVGGSISECTISKGQLRSTFGKTQVGGESSINTSDRTRIVANLCKNSITNLFHIITCTYFEVGHGLLKIGQHPLDSRGRTQAELVGPNRRKDVISFLEIGIVTIGSGSTESRNNVVENSFDCICFRIKISRGRSNRRQTEFNPGFVRGVGRPADLTLCGGSSFSGLTIEDHVRHTRRERKVVNLAGLRSSNLTISKRTKIKLRRFEISRSSSTCGSRIALEDEKRHVLHTKEIACNCSIIVGCRCLGIRSRNLRRNRSGNVDHEVGFHLAAFGVVVRIHGHLLNAGGESQKCECTQKKEDFFHGFVKKSELLNMLLYLFLLVIIAGRNLYMVENFASMS